MINPWIFYFANLADHLQAVGAIGTILCSVTLLVEAISFPIEGHGFLNEKQQKQLRYAFLVCLFVVVFTPSKRTCMEMFVASILTPELLAMGKEAVLEFIKEIMEIAHAALRG